MPTIWVRACSFAHIISETTRAAHAHPKCFPLNHIGSYRVLDDRQFFAVRPSWKSSAVYARPHYHRHAVAVGSAWTFLNNYYWQSFRVCVCVCESVNEKKSVWTLTNEKHLSSEISILLSRLFLSKFRGRPEPSADPIVFSWTRRAP